MKDLPFRRPRTHQRQNRLHLHYGHRQLEAWRKGQYPQLDAADDLHRVLHSLGTTHNPNFEGTNSPSFEVSPVRTPSPEYKRTDRSGSSRNYRQEGPVWRYLLRTAVGHSLCQLARRGLLLRDGRCLPPLLRIHYGDHASSSVLRANWPRRISSGCGTSKRRMPAGGDLLFERKFASVEAHILNLAMWGMTARSGAEVSPRIRGKISARVRHY